MFDVWSCDVCLLISVACIDTDLVIVCSCMLLARCGCRKLLLGDAWVLVEGAWWLYFGFGLLYWLDARFWVLLSGFAAP